MNVPFYTSATGSPETSDHTIGADIDPELECQLAQAADDEAVEAVFFLRQDGRGSHRQDRLSTFLQLAREHDSVGIIASTYLPRLGALIVRAHPALIRQLIARPEVEIACANRGTGAVLLETGPEAVIRAMKQLPIR